MSVYTAIGRAQLEDFFNDYALGDIVNFEGIEAGIDNTNYRVTTSHGEFVLTIFESLTDSELSHIIGLLVHLGRNELSCPIPQRDRQNRLLRKLNNKPAAIFNRLPGIAVNAPSIAQCRAVGSHLARLHLCAQDINLPLINSSDLSACQTIFNNIHTFLQPTDIELIRNELCYQAKFSGSGLPGGVIHGDLFKDNVLFTGDQLSGMLDFYNACAGSWLLDIAITSNDWCCDNGIVDPEKMVALLTAYRSVRPLKTIEQQLWPTVLRAAALRFWLSRLQHQIHPRVGTLTQQKDPVVFRRLLKYYRQQQQRVTKPLSPNVNTFINRKSA